MDPTNTVQNVPPPSNSNCPALPSNFTDISPYPTVSGPGATVRMASGVTGAFPLPPTNPGHNSGLMQVGENVISPNGGIVIEMAISKCKGFIPTSAADIAAAGSCYQRSTNGSYNSMAWAGKNSGNYPMSALDGAGFCPALEANGQYYFNLRYTYQACNYGVCGEIVGWYDSYY